MNNNAQSPSRRRKKTAVLPLGSFEQHGPHLPLGTDIYIIEALAGAIAADLGVFMLPVQPVSTCYEHGGKNGSIHYSADIFYRFVVKIVESAYKNGFDNIAVLPGHGGIFVLGPAVDFMNVEHKGLKAVVIDPYDLGPVFLSKFGEGDLHAGDMETSLMLHLHPELVDTSKAADCVPDKPREYLNYGSIFTMSPSGVWGRPTLASAEKGKALFERAVESTVDKIISIFDL